MSAAGRGNVSYAFPFSLSPGAAHAGNWLQEFASGRKGPAARPSLMEGLGYMEIIGITFDHRYKLLTVPQLFNSVVTGASRWTVAVPQPLTPSMIK